MPHTQLCYRSRIAPHSPADPVSRDIDGILASARRHNAQAGVTGALLLADGYYFQVLEGRAEAVDAAYYRIERDCRHSEPVVLRRRLSQMRLFPGQPLYFSKMLTEPAERLPDLYRWYAEDPETVGGEELLDMLTQVAQDIDQRRATADAMMM